MRLKKRTCVETVEEYRGVAQQGWSGGVELKYLLSAVM